MFPIRPPVAPEGVRPLLAPGGLLLIQVLNYVGIRTRGVRNLPLNFREGDEEGEEIVFLRLMKPLEDGRALFFPTTLSLRPDDEKEPVRVASTRRVLLRAWTADELGPRLEQSGFSVELCGDMKGGPFVPERSNDLVVVAALQT